MANADLEQLKKELKWIQIQEETGPAKTVFEKLKSKGIVGCLVPVGCLATAGVLCRGLYFLKRNNNREQQRMMRYRVGIQGITIALALISIFVIPQQK